MYIKNKFNIKVNKDKNKCYGNSIDHYKVSNNLTYYSRILYLNRIPIRAGILLKKIIKI